MFTISNMPHTSPHMLLTLLHCTMVMSPNSLPHSLTPPSLPPSQQPPLGPKLQPLAHLSGWSAISRFTAKDREKEKQKQKRGDVKKKVRWRRERMGSKAC
ncbi:hypothetical protein M758_7G112300 [Ceratodon purpureus]|nr:hypothetical protein M758_7G112300 [Ceratodon purpureus]